MLAREARRRGAPLGGRHRVADTVAPRVEPEALGVGGLEADGARRQESAVARRARRRAAAGFLAARGGGAGQAPVHQREAEQQLARVVEAPLRVAALPVLYLRAEREERRAEQQADDRQHHGCLDE